MEFWIFEIAFLDYMLGDLCYMFGTFGADDTAGRRTHYIILLHDDTNAFNSFIVFRDFYQPYQLFIIGLLTWSKNAEL
jgi:hypothetical protein